MDVRNLPLFPLNAVLFPRMPLRLHIFEERYKQLIRDCLGEGVPFGVVLIREGNEVGPGAIPEEAGTMARIVAVQALPQDRMNLLIEGTRRFRLLDRIEAEQPYMMGVTEPLSDAPADPEVAGPLMEEVRELFHSYFRALVSHAGVKMPGYELPDDPEEFSFVIAAVVRMENSRRQSVLESTDTIARLEGQRELLASELSRIQRLSGGGGRADRVDPASARPYFSRN